MMLEFFNVLLNDVNEIFVCRLSATELHCEHASSFSVTTVAYRPFLLPYRRICYDFVKQLFPSGIFVHGSQDCLYFNMCLHPHVLYSGCLDGYLTRRIDPCAFKHARPYLSSCPFYKKCVLYRVEGLCPPCMNAADEMCKSVRRPRKNDEQEQVRETVGDVSADGIKDGGNDECKG